MSTAARWLTFAGLLLTLAGAALLFWFSFLQKQIGNVILRPGEIMQFDPDRDNRDVPRSEWQPVADRFNKRATTMNRTGFGLVTLGTLLQMVGLFL